MALLSAIETAVFAGFAAWDFADGRGGHAAVNVGLGVCALLMCVYFTVDGARKRGCGGGE